MRIDEILELDYAAPQPKNRRRGIGIIGAGGIVNEAHLPAYAKAGFNVVAIYDARADAVEELGQFAGHDAATQHDHAFGHEIEVEDIVAGPAPASGESGHRRDAR